MPETTTPRLGAVYPDKFPGELARLEVRGMLLVMTCMGHPEQYDVYRPDSTNAAGFSQTAYLRLRYGHFRVSVPDYGGETVYSREPKGEGYFTEEERGDYLAAALDAVESWLLGTHFNAVRERLEELD